MVWCHGTETWKSCLLMTEEKSIEENFSNGVDEK